MSPLVSTERDPTLYTFSVDDESESFDAQLLFAYKLNWQTVLYVGVGEGRILDTIRDDLEPVGRQAFVKLSYAFQG